MEELAKLLTNVNINSESAVEIAEIWYKAQILNCVANALCVVIAISILIAFLCIISRS